jgi:hypothetical protein
MKTKFTITLAVAAGFIRGIASHYSLPATAYAQAPASPQEIRARKFVLVDESGVPRAVFGIEDNGTPMIEADDSKSHVFAASFRSWKGPIYGFLPYPKKPTLLTAKP